MTGQRVSGHVADRWHLKRAPRPGETVCRGECCGQKWRSGRVPDPAKHARGRRWQVEYTDPDGKLHYPCFTTEDEARAFLTKIQADMLRGTYRDPGAGQTTLRKYALEVFLPAQVVDPITRDRIDTALRVHILPALGSKRLQELERYPSQIQAWVSSLNMAPSTVRRVSGHLSTIMRWAVRDQLIAANPCQSITLPKVVKRRIEPWPPEVTARVRAALPARYRGLVDAGIGAGLRQSELFAMSVENTDFLRCLVHVRVQVKIVGGRMTFAAPKGAKERTVPIARQTAVQLAAHLAAFPAMPVTLPWHEPGTRRHGKPHTLNLLFITPAGGAVNRNSFNPNVWRVARKAAGLDDDDRVNGCHMMRHVWASTLVAAGVDVRTVAEYMGHSDGGALVLKTYSHLLPDAEDRARKALEIALGKTLTIPAVASDATRT